MSKLKIAIDRARHGRHAAGAVAALIGVLVLWEQASLPTSDSWAGYLALLGALLLFAYRNFIEIDIGANRVAHRMGFLFALLDFGARFDTRKIRRITLGEVAVSITDSDGYGRTDTRYAIKINGASGEVLCTHREFWAARHVAERISRALCMELETHMLGASSVRTVEELDLTLAERWRRAGLLKEAPRLEGMKQIVVEQDGDSGVVSVPVPSGPRATAALALVALLGALYAASSIWQVPALLLVGIGALAILVIGHLILQSTGHQRLRFTDTDVEVRHGLLPFVERIRIDEVEELLVSGTRIGLLGDRGYLTVEQPRDPGDREILRQFIERQIAQRQRSSRSDSRPCA